MPSVVRDKSRLCGVDLLRVFRRGWRHGHGNALIGHLPMAGAVVRELVQCLVGDDRIAQSQQAPRAWNEACVTCSNHPKNVISLQVLYSVLFEVSPGKP